MKITEISPTSFFFIYFFHWLDLFPQRLLRKSLHVVETVKRVMLHFHCLVVPVGLARLWIPAFAGMTMKAKAAGMGGSSENTP
jgi:hypothetical protein